MRWCDADDGMMLLWFSMVIYTWCYIQFLEWMFYHFYVSLVNLTVSWAIKNRITLPAFMLKIFQNVGHTMLTGQPQMFDVFSPSAGGENVMVPSLGSFILIQVWTQFCQRRYLPVPLEETTCFRTEDPKLFLSPTLASHARPIERFTG